MNAPDEITTAEIVMHPSADRLNNKNAYIQSNRKFIENFISTDLHLNSRNVSNTVLQCFYPKPPYGLKFIEFEEIFQAKALESTDDESLRSGTVKIKSFEIDWQIICFDSSGQIINDPINSIKTVHSRKLDLKSGDVSTKEQVYRICENGY